MLSGKQEITSLVLKQPTTSSLAPQLKDVLVSQSWHHGTPTKVSVKEHKKLVLHLEAVSKQQKISEWLLL